MEWSGKHDLVPAEKCLLLWNLGYQHPYRSKERAKEMYGTTEIAVVALIIRNSKSIKKSLRDRLTLRHKAKIHQEENAPGITCERTELVQALKEII